jgi:exonuclease III
MLEHEIGIGGDWNCFIDRNLDCNGGNPGTKTKTLAEISKIKSKYDLIDIFRAKHPDLIRYTWRCPTLPHF